MNNINEHTRKLYELIKGHSRSGNLSLYSEAQEQGISYSELLEQIDPSEPGSSLDSFERQLQMHEITPTGRRAISMEQFFHGGGLTLLPEFVLREIKTGYNLAENPTNLIASVVYEAGPTIRPVYFKMDSASRSFGKRGPGSTSAYPKVQLAYRDKEVVMTDRGLQFDFSYRVIRNQKLTEFRTYLRYVGAQMAYDEITEIYNTGLNGDGTSDAAEDVFTGNAGTFAYTDLVHLAMSFDVPNNMTHIIAKGTDIETIVNLSQFQSPDAWRESELFQRSGNYKSFLPVNAKLVVAPEATATKVLGLDSRFAIRETVAQPVMIEAEKVINQKLESAVISKESCYTIMVDGAAKVSDY